MAKPKPDDLLTPAAVGKLRHAGRSAVHRAILRGDLPAVPILDDRGEVAAYAILRRDAERWEKRVQGRRAGES